MFPGWLQIGMLVLESMEQMQAELSWNLHAYHRIEC